MNNGITGLAMVTTDQLGTYIYAACNGCGVYRSNNLGLLWTAANVGLGSFMDTFASIDTILFVSGMEFVYKSTDYGTSWSPILQVPGTSSSLTATAGTLLAGTYDAGLYRSTNTGVSWSGANTGMPNLPVLTFCSYDTITFAGTRGGGVFLSTNRGYTWSDIGLGLAHKYIGSLVVAGDHLLAGTLGGGVWKRPLNEILVSVRDHSHATPNRISLYQNYPNPFNPTTTIKYQIPNSNGQLGFGASDLGFVSLKVFDLLGREVATLVNEVKEPGEHSVVWDAAMMPSGVYFYRLQAGTHIATRRMLLLK